ncbi:EscU/YscU/HrcU family type III secretion system export apparatus switch protein [Methylocapsa acidiphila]|uniref:EscU/YscU/HrcU family type III secretion system export apparatus switch protein n=1 Tax=Methylocapsa acidiphila TaxID=133552 RepID=UPI00040211A1|nr:EscU/YscU/HrcU family type III secretion system export apparatus switch protein [Methylocapsa acidiphila]
MSEQEDKESKTEDPTEGKIRNEMERGNRPFSREAATFASFVGMLIIASFLIRDAGRSVTITLERLLAAVDDIHIGNGYDAVALAGVIARSIFNSLIPLFAVFVLVGLSASFIQNPPSISFERIKPDLQRISLVNGWSRIFGARGQVEFLKGACKMLFMGVVVAIFFRSELDVLVNAMAIQPETIPELILTTATRLLSIVCILMALLLVADLLWVRRQWFSDLRMSKQEIKDELKRNEGDPIRKARLRSLALDRLRKSMIAAVPKATVVIANPTHYAIALRYVKEEGGAPVVLSKGQDFIALKIKEIAAQHSIPIIEDKALARAMYERVEIDQAIPVEFYRAIAEVIHLLYAKGGKRTAVAN